MKAEEATPSASPAGGRGYRPWKGVTRSSVWRWWPIARSSLKLLFAQRLIWFLLSLALLNFLFHFSLVYFMAEVRGEFLLRGREPPVAPEFLEKLVFTGEGRSFRDFMVIQNAVVMLMLAFCGPILVGNDFRFGSFAFYLSKPIGKFHYFMGKLIAAACATALVTLAPALLLFVEYGAFTDSADYYLQSQRIFWAILGYGTVVSLVSATLLLGVSAWFQRTLPVFVVWSSIYLLIPPIASLLTRAFRGATGRDPGVYLHFIDFWGLLRWLGNGFFGLDGGQWEGLVPYCLSVLALWTAMSLWVFWRRVQAVIVVP